MPSYLQKGLNYIYTFSLSLSGTGGLFCKETTNSNLGKTALTLCNCAPETKPFPSARPNPLSIPCWEEGMEKEGDYFEAVSDLGNRGVEGCVYLIGSIKLQRLPD